MASVALIQKEHNGEGDAVQSTLYTMKSFHVINGCEFKNKITLKKEKNPKHHYPNQAGTRQV
jgi:hypothetical protein